MIQTQVKILSLHSNSSVSTRLYKKIWPFAFDLSVRRSANLPPNVQNTQLRHIMPKQTCFFPHLSDEEYDVDVSKSHTVKTNSEGTRSYTPRNGCGRRASMITDKKTVTVRIQLFSCFSSFSGKKYEPEIETTNNPPSVGRSTPSVCQSITHFFMSLTDNEQLLFL